MTASATFMRMTATTASGLPTTDALMTAAGGTLQDGTMPLAGTPTGSSAKREGRGRNAGKKAKTGPTFWTRNATAAGSTMSASESTRLMTCAPMNPLTVMPWSTLTTPMTTSTRWSATQAWTALIPVGGAA